MRPRFESTARRSPKKDAPALPQNPHSSALRRVQFSEKAFCLKISSYGFFCIWLRLDIHARSAIQNLPVACFFLCSPFTITLILHRRYYSLTM
jgi:hypothetical protein